MLERKKVVEGCYIEWMIIRRHGGLVKYRVACVWHSSTGRLLWRMMVRIW